MKSNFQNAEEGCLSLDGMVFAEIIIPLALPKTFTWSVPQQLRHTLKVGCRVEVNLGKNKKYAGIVKKIHQDKPEFVEPKEILNLLAFFMRITIGTF